MGKSQRMGTHLTKCFSCAWHGCPECFKNRQTPLPTGKTAELTYEATLGREEIVKKDFDLKVVWEHEITAMLKEDPKMKKFFESTVLMGPLDPRDAYFGGRTGPLRMIKTLTEGDGMRISYLDIQVTLFNLHQSMTVL